jgi:hypothetical protein
MHKVCDKLLTKRLRPTFYHFIFTFPKFLPPCTFLVVLASPTSGDQHLYEVATNDVQTITPSGLGTSENGWHPLRPWWQRARAQAGGNSYPESGLVKPPRRNTRAFSPAGVFEKMAPLRLAAKKSRPHAPSVPMRSTPAYLFCNGEYKLA